MIPAPKEEESPALGPTGEHGPNRAGPGTRGPLGHPRVLYSLLGKNLVHVQLGAHS